MQHLRHPMRSHTPSILVIGRRGHRAAAQALAQSLVLVLALGASPARSTLDVNVPASEAGFVSLSFSRPLNTVFDWYGMRLQRVGDTGEEPAIHLQVPRRANDSSQRFLGEDRGRTVTVVCLAVQPGRYVLRRFMSGAGIGASTRVWGVAEAVVIPVDVSAGRLTYLGRFHAVNNVTTWLGLPATPGARFEISNRLEFDLGVVPETSGCKRAEASVQIPDAGAMADPGVTVVP